MNKFAVLSLVLNMMAVGESSRVYAELPIAPKEKLSESRFGLTIKDPYRWMENADDPRLYDWRRAELQYTETQTDSSLRDILFGEFQRLYTPPDRMEFEDLYEDDEYLYQGVHARSFNDKASANGGGGQPYEFVVTPGNTDLQTLQVRKTATKELLPDLLRVKLFDPGATFWDPDGKSFVYGTFRDGRIGGSTLVILRHVLGTAQRDDELLYQADQAGDDYDFYKADGTFWLLRQTGQGNQLLRRDPRSGTWDIVLATQSGAMTTIDFEEGKFWLVSFVNQPMGEVVTFDIQSRQLITVVPARELPIDLFKTVLTDNGLYISYVRNAANELVFYDLGTQQSHTIPLPHDGQVVDVMGGSGEGKDTIHFETYIHRYDTYSFDHASQQLELVKRGERPDIELEALRVDYAPLRGVQAPIWIVKRKDVTLTKDTPIYLYGYGGFRINLLPTYRPNYYLPWLRRGGAVAFATLPGGLEYGEPWHQLGVGLNKRNVFDAFAAAARHLIGMKWTSRDKLVIGGGSNGGLLVAATARYYPNLFRATAPMVGVHDMTRFSLFTSGPSWIRDYGNRDIKTEYRNLVRMSPYNALARQTRYPDTMVMTAELDDRVVPAHSYKFLARLQDRFPAQRNLLYVVKGTGHRLFASTKTENAHAASIMWSFLMEEVGIQQ